jgi:hypothetical protein
MASIIDNTIMNYSLLWPGSTDGVAGGSKASEAAKGGKPEPGSLFIRPASAESGLGWLPSGMGENVDLMA